MNNQSALQLYIEAWVGCVVLRKGARTLNQRLYKVRVGCVVLGGGGRPLNKHFSCTLSCGLAVLCWGEREGDHSISV